MDFQWSRVVLKTITIILLLLPVIVQVGAQTAMPWLVPMDSQWQEGNGCFRMLAGQLPGRDFQVFHGIGCVWIHMPFFLLAGCGENAVAFSHYATCALMVISMLKLAFGSGTGGWFVAVAVLSLASALPLFRFVVDPLFNMAATRSAIGVVAMILITSTTIPGGKWTLRLVPPLILALVLAAFHDQGTIVALAFIVRVLVEVVRRRSWPEERWFWAASGLLLFPAVEWLLCAGKPEEMRLFHWRDLMSTQIWFWAPVQNFLETPKDLLFFIDRRLILALFLHGTGWWFAWTAGPRQKGLQWSLFVYGLVSMMPMLGMLVPSYFIGMGLSGLASVICGLGHQVERRRDLITSVSMNLKNRVSPLIAIGVTLGLIGVASARIFFWAVNDPANMRNTNNVVDAHVAAIQGDRKLWSFYRSMIDYRVVADWSEAEDLIIYAVGTDRSVAYADKLVRAKPLFVNTPAGTNFSDWLSVRFWQANRHVLRHYRPVCREGAWVTWRREDRVPSEIAESSWVPGKLIKQGDGWNVTLEAQYGPVDQPTLWECRLIHHRVSDGMVDGLANRLRRWVVRSPEGRPVVLPFALDPSIKQTEMEFPIVRRDADEVVLSIKPEGLWPAGTMEMLSAEFRPVRGVDPADLPIMLPQAASGKVLEAEAKN